MASSHGEGGAELARRADESVSVRFTRIMNASTSSFGVLTDPPLVAIVTGVLLLAFLGALGGDAGPIVVRVCLALMILPVAMALIVSVALMGARRRVVAWIAAQPFPVENMNAVLNGLGESIEVTFTGEMPAAADLNVELDKVHPDSFVTETSDEARTIEIRIGVVDSKRNPSGSNHERYARVRALIEQALCPLAERHPIACVRVK